MTDLTFTSDLTVELVAHSWTDMMAVNAARVSTRGEMANQDPNAEITSKDAGLINYLMRDSHLSPFEHGSFTFFVHAPIFVFRQWHRHRTWSYNEESGRYTVLKPVFYVPDGGRPLVQHGKVGHYTFEAGTEEQLLSVHHNMQHVCQVAYSAYERMLEEGVAPEMARGVLPVTTYTSMYATANPRNVLAFLKLRMDKHAQYEIRQMANQVYDELMKVCPHVVDAWARYNFQEVED